MEVMDYLGLAGAIFGVAAIITGAVVIVRGTTSKKQYQIKKNSSPRF